MGERDTAGSAYVVGISSPSGGGKTVVVNRLVQLLSDSVPVFFDEYDQDTVHSVSFRDWLSEGADYNAWKAPLLAAHLKRLKTGNPIQHPLDGRPIPPHKVIIFDAPLGYAHQETGSLIDFMAFIDTPLDVAMARRLFRDANAKTFEALLDEMKAYLDYGRHAYLEMDRQVKPMCDLVVDGLDSVNMQPKSVHPRSLIECSLALYLTLRYIQCMHVISRKALRVFWERHSDSKTALSRWFKILDQSNFDSFDALRATFPSADKVDDLIVFNIGGNKYRLVASIHFNRGKVYIRHVLTHHDYDQGAWKP